MEGFVDADGVGQLDGREVDHEAFLHDELWEVGEVDAFAENLIVSVMHLFGRRFTQQTSPRR